MVCIRLTKPRVRFVRVGVPELLAIDGLDLLTGLSSLTTCTLRPVFSGPTSPRTRPNSIPGLVADAARGYSPTCMRSIARSEGLRSDFANGDDDHADRTPEFRLVLLMTVDRTEPVPDNPPVLAVGGSAGSVRPLVEIVRDLPWDLPAAVLVTIHIGEQTRLPQILSRSGPLRATQARDREVLEHGRIYVAPPGRHLITRNGLALLSPGPRVNRHRPAVDVMFASAAEWVDGRTVGVVLSGVLDDGAVGAALIDQVGGHVLVQNPDEAEFAGMPRAALAAAPGARAVPVGHLARWIRHSLDAAQSRSSGAVASRAEWGTDMDMVESADPSFLLEEESKLTRLTCPDCGGSMAQVDLPQISYFRCHVGHQFAPQALAAAQVEASEKKLWSAVAALEEQAAVLRYLQGRALPQDESVEQDPTSAAQDRYVEEIATRAIALRSQVRAWSSNPPELDSPPE